MSLTLGETLGAYRVVEQLGQGGMATVFKAYHAALDRYVAIKVMHAAFKADPNFEARFQREARVVARLDHLHIVPVYDYAEHNGAPYLVMKFIEGETLKARLQRGPLTPAEVMRCVEALGAALDYAHRQGILHRDIKPSNVMLGKDGGLYLADFGLARMALAGESTLSADSMLGTPQYMSPEQARGQKELDAGTDLYSLGVVVYELLVGRAPFSADTPFAVMHDHIYTPLPPPRAINPNLPAAVEDVLLKALAKERVDRYASAPEMVGALRAALGDTLLEGSPLVVPQRTPPADPAALTPAAATAGAASAGLRTAATVGAPAPAEPTVVRPFAATAPAAAAAPPAKTGFRLAGWQLVLGAGLMVILALGAAALARRGAQANQAVLPTETALRATDAPTPVPDDAALLVQAQQALVADDVERAVTLLDQAIALDPNDTAVMVRAGDLLLAHGHTLGALERYYVPASALEFVNPSEHAVALQAHVSLAFYVLAADATARDFLEQQAADNPDQLLPVLALHRHRVFFAEGAGVEAGLEALLRDSPNHAAALLIMGDYYLSQGQALLAGRFYQRVRDVPRPANREALDWGDQEAQCNLDKLRRLRSAATLETTCADLLSLLTGK